MAAIMVDARGVGLAAPQLGSLRRLVVVRTGEEGEDDRRPLQPAHRLALRGGGGRLRGLPVDRRGHRWTWPRAVAIRVEAQDVAGRPLELEPEGFEARVIQHELDHLDGVLILDRTAPEQRREALRALRDEG